jgi:hypothetical protein
VCKGVNMCICVDQPHHLGLIGKLVGLIGKFHIFIKIKWVLYIHTLSLASFFAFACVCICMCVSICLYVYVCMCMCVCVCSTLSLASFFACLVFQVWDMWANCIGSFIGEGLIGVCHIEREGLIGVCHIEREGLIC